VAAFEGLKSGNPEDNGFKELRVLEKKNDAQQVWNQMDARPRNFW
jgi:hypothetical protein